MLRSHRDHLLIMEVGRWGMFFILSILFVLQFLPTLPSHNKQIGPQQLENGDSHCVRNKVVSGHRGLLILDSPASVGLQLRVNYKSFYGYNVNICRLIFFSPRSILLAPLKSESLHIG